jgi:hypothetical protein
MHYRYPFANADEARKRSVWAKAAVAPGYHSDYVRMDACGKLIEYLAHGNRNHAFGWEIDHIIPTALGGGDELSNLQPLHWQNNAAKGDKLYWRCAVGSKAA